MLPNSILYCLQSIRPPRALVALVLWPALLLAACETVYVPPGITPYRIDVQQGNVVTPGMVMKLKPEMTRPQVRFVLGSPVLGDPFRTDRWDYVYALDKPGKSTTQKRLTVYFENDLLARIEGAPEDLICADRKLLRGADANTDVPAECSQYSAEEMAERAVPKPVVDNDAPPPEEKGFFGRLWEKVGF